MADQRTNSSLVPLTLIWDVAQLQSTDVNSKEFKELLVRMYQYINSIAIALNEKDAGLYLLGEFVNGQQYFPNPLTKLQQNRTVFRKVINFGTLPNAGVKSVPHYIPINSGYTFTRIYGTASDTTGLNYIPIPYVEPSGAIVGITVDATNVNISTVDDRTNYTVCYIVLEYLKM